MPVKSLERMEEKDDDGIQDDTMTMDPTMMNGTPWFTQPEPPSPSSSLSSSKSNNVENISDRPQVVTTSHPTRTGEGNNMQDPPLLETTASECTWFPPSNDLLRRNNHDTDDYDNDNDNDRNDSNDKDVDIEQGYCTQEETNSNRLSCPWEYASSEQEDDDEPSFSVCNHIDNYEDDNTAADHDVDHDHDHDALSDSDSTLSSQESILLTDRRMRNVERLEQFMSTLDQKYNSKLPQSIRPKRRDNQQESESESESIHSNQGQGTNQVGPPRGMLFDKSVSSTNLLDSNMGSLEKLYHRYPYRESQIRFLGSLLSAAIGQVPSTTANKPFATDVYVPAPIFVMGSSGTGKTSVVRDVVKLMEQSSTIRHESTQESISVAMSSVATTSYVNCATLEPSSINRLLSSAYYQLIPIEFRISKRRKRRRRKKTKFARVLPQDHSYQEPAAALQPSDHGGPSDSNTVGTRDPSASSNNNGTVQSELQKDSNESQQDLRHPRRVQPDRQAKLETMQTANHSSGG